MKAPVSSPAHTSDLTYQGEQFLSLLSRLDPSADLDTEFVRWANSKDLGPHARSAIAREVREILARGGQP